MIFFRITKYLRYLFLSGSRRGHGIHSPFVFYLVSRVFRNKIEPDIVFTIERVRKRMKADQHYILVSDLGSGSEKLKTELRKVSDIAKYSSVPVKYGILLSNMSAEFGKPFILEFGTSLGISALYLAAACPNAIVETMEGCPVTSDIARENFKEAGLNNIKVLTGSFDELLPAILKGNKIPGLIFIDGNHKKGPVVNYFTRVAEISDNNTVIIIDDIYYSREMEEAWNEIKQCKKVSLTIDIFRMGIVFFRKGINRKDYIIRY
jgi:predicted O-methyltransferase YrrM